MKEVQQKIKDSYSSKYKSLHYHVSCCERLVDFNTRVIYACFIRYQKKQCEITENANFSKITTGLRREVADEQREFVGVLEAKTF